MDKKLKELLQTTFKLNDQSYQLLMYLVMGVLTTIVSIGSFYLFEKVFLMDYRPANLLSWVFAVSFAYVSNRTFVFASQKEGAKALFKEFISFTSSRVFTLLVEMVLIIVIVEWLKLNTLVAKVLTNVVVLVLNYLLSKLIVFK